MNKKVIITASIIGVFVLGVVISLIFLNRNTPTDGLTGGSGQPEIGTLILTGYETRSNDSASIQLGSFLSSGQQINIRSFLEALLYEKEPRGEYSGVIVPGSVDVNYTTNVISFKVQIEEPKVLYTVNFNTVSDEMSVLDEKGQSVKPPSV